MLLAVDASLEVIDQDGETPFSAAVHMWVDLGTKRHLRIILKILERFAWTTASGIAHHSTAKGGPIAGSSNDKASWPDRNALHKNQEAVERLFNVSTDLTADLLKENGKTWKYNVCWEHAEMLKRLKQKGFKRKVSDPSEGPIQDKYMELRGLLAETFRLLFNKGLGARAEAATSNSGHLGHPLTIKSQDISTGEANLWRRAEESGLDYLWDMKTAEQVCHRFSSTKDFYPDGTDYLTLVLEGCTGYLRRRASKELFDIMEEMATWERFCINDDWQRDGATLKALEWWFRARNLGSEFSTDGSRHILLYSENVPPASSQVTPLDSPPKSEYYHRKTSLETTNRKAGYFQEHYSAAVLSEGYPRIPCAGRRHRSHT